MDKRIKDIAKLITESVPGSSGMNIPKTPSQIVSQVLMRGTWNLAKDLQQALGAINEFGKHTGIDPALIQQALQYAKLKYRFIQKGATASQIVSQALGGNYSQLIPDGEARIRHLAQSVGVDPQPAIDFYKRVAN